MKLRCDKIKEPKDLKNWVNKEWSSSKQQDGASCGIFVLMVHFLFSMKLNFKQSVTITNFKIKILH